MGGSAKGLDSDKTRRGNPNESVSGLVTESEGKVTCWTSDVTESSDGRDIGVPSPVSGARGLAAGPGESVDTERSSSDKVDRLALFGSRNLSATFLALATE